MQPVSFEVPQTKKRPVKHVSDRMTRALDTSLRTSTYSVGQNSLPTEVEKIKISSVGIMVTAKARV